VHPQRESLGHISDLTQILLSVFDSDGTEVAGTESGADSLQRQVVRLSR